MDVRLVTSLADKLQPFQERLEACWAEDLSDPAVGQRLNDALFTYNEAADALVPALARAAGLSAREVRDVFEPKEEFEAYFAGTGADFLRAAAAAQSLSLGRYRSNWVEAAGFDPGTDLTRLPPPPRSLAADPESGLSL